jgi:hypothetical protein
MLNGQNSERRPSFGSKNKGGTNNDRSISSSKDDGKKEKSGSDEDEEPVKERWNKLKEESSSSETYEEDEREEGKKTSHGSGGQPPVIEPLHLEKLTYSSKDSSNAKETDGKKHSYYSSETSDKGTKSFCGTGSHSQSTDDEDTGSDGEGGPF